MRQRRRTRLAGFDYHQSGAYFVTVVARRRACLFGEIVADAMRPNAVGALVTTCWRELASYFQGLSLDAFVVMPNHVHGILVLERAGQARPLHLRRPDRAGQARPLHLARGDGDAGAGLPTIVGSFKSAASRRAGMSLWQRGYFDRIVRNDAELEALRRYVAENPLRWALDRDHPSRPHTATRGSRD